MGFKPWDKMSSYTTKASFFNAVFTQLLYFDKNYSIKPGLFLDWSWKPDLREFEFKVDISKKFDNERPLRLEDIEFAIVKNFLTEGDDSKHYFLSEIVGTSELKKGQKFRTGLCKGIKIVSPNTLKIKLKSANPLFLYSFGELMPPIAPIEDFDSDLFNFKKIPRGTGKYEIVWSDPNSSLVKLRLKRSEMSRSHPKSPLTIDYFSHGTAVEHDADLTAGAGNKTVVKNPNYKTIIGSIPLVINVLDFNYNTSLSKNINFRKAISLAINRTELNETYNTLRNSHELIPSTYYGFSNRKFEYSPEKSKKIVEKHFKSVSSPTKRLKALYHGPKNSEKKPYIKALQRQLEIVGLFFDFEPIEVISFEKGNHLDIQFVIYGLVTSFVDPTSPFANYTQDTSMGLNHDPDDNTVDNMYLTIKETFSKEQRAAKLKELTKYMQENYVMIPLQESVPSFMAKLRIESIGIEQIFYAIDLSEVRIKE